ncbi:hypothetical protein DV738_g4241, partial [Chaetothyriales sp. CBS 135597]
MMAEGRSLTLRKKRKERPVISSPKLLSGPNTARSAPQAQIQEKPPLQSRPALASSTATPRAKDGNAASDTADLVKRRYSTRYNQLPDFSNLDAPPLPLPLPGSSSVTTAALKRTSRGRSPKRPSRESGAYLIKVDQDALSDANLQHERYVTDLLANASAQDIQDYQNSLRRIKHRTSMELQQSVYQNRTQFIKISKEAEKLKSEMQVLRGLMADLTRALQTTGAAASASGSASGSSDSSAIALSHRHTKRSSVANLESMWNMQLQSLWKTVERSQKFLPAIPGRHVIMENGQWIELDSATWKPKRPVHLVLLNDHVLIASKKRKRLDPNIPQAGPAPTKLVAEECFALPDIDIVDMSTATNAMASTPSEEKTLQSAFTIRAAGRSLTYRHEKRDPMAKATFLQTLRKAVEDLRKANKIDTKKPSAQTDSLNYLASRDPAIAHNADILSSLSSSSTASKVPDILIDVDGKQQNFRWVEAQIDELDIDIALQRFDQAVARVEKLRELARTSLKSNNLAQELIRVKLDERAAQLANILCRDLVDTPSFMEATKRTISYLARLGAEDRARQAYLDARTASLTSRARQCLFEGDLHKYIFTISYLYFTMIRNTVLIYQVSFNPAAMSAVVKWANDHLEHFNELLQRQLSTVDRNAKAWRECMDLVWEHERTVLGTQGLDFGEVVGRGLELRPVSAGSGLDDNNTQSRGTTPA